MSRHKQRSVSRPEFASINAIDTWGTSVEPEPGFVECVDDGTATAVPRRTVLEKTRPRRGNAFHQNLILLDGQMPRMHGEALGLRLRESPQLRNIPVALVTGRTGAAFTGTEERTVARLTKPLQPGDLLGAIERALSAPPSFADRARHADVRGTPGNNRVEFLLVRAAVNSAAGVNLTGWLMLVSRRTLEMQPQTCAEPTRDELLVQRGLQFGSGAERL